MESTEELTIHKGFTILKSLFKDGRNEILLANRIADDLKVVIKQSVLSENISMASKIGHEYGILKELDHPGIPKAYDLLYDGNTVGLVQEYLDGTDLRELIFKRKFSHTEVIDIAIQLAGILLYLHQKGVIHMDINPGNIMMTKEGTLKLLDFGISSNLHSETNELLNVDQIEGTLIYISPEQTGRTAYSVTHSCDLYSCGILLYEMVAGKPPFDSLDPLEIIHFHLSRNPKPLRILYPGLPEGLEQIIFKLMEKNPDDRYHSAAGLKADLEIIAKHIHSNEPLRSFKAGLNDITEQYKQSQKLYGREEELQELLGYYKNLTHLKSVLVLVAGYSGVGKSALIKHAKFPIIQSKGTFISGKFDQFKKDIPYYAFIEAIQEFIKNLLSEPEDQINFWRKRINFVLGENAGLITEVIPQLSKIIDKQPQVPKLQPAEQEARFHMVLLDFVYVFSTSLCPLVIFLDDLQWADLSSLNLVKRILENPRQDSIMILGAYRDNEVEKGHPLLITLKQISEAKRHVKFLNLESLSIETTIQITADSYGMESARASDLGRHVFSKTKGNPFFIHSFLKALYDNHFVKKDPVENWIWDQQEIDALGYTDNVIDLMTEGLIVLPESTQEALKYAAVLGNTFDLEDLSNISEKSEANVYNNLKPAINGGYINPIDKRYRALALSSIGSLNDAELQFSGSTAQFTFSHDKVQHAAYNLIAFSELPSVHLRIGRLLLKSREKAQLDENIFELLNHFAISSHLIEEKEEKIRIAELSLIAGRKAKDSTSYNQGVHFLLLAKFLLGDYSWNDNYDLTYNVLIELGECEYLNDNPQKAEQYFKELLSNSRTNFEKLRVYYVHSSLYLKIGNTKESLRLGLEAVRLYQIRFPGKKMAIKVATLFKMAKYLFLFSTKYKNPERLLHLKDCQEEEIIALNKFLIDLATSAYQQDQNLMMLVIFKIVKSYTRYGFTDASGWGFSGFSVVVLSALKMQKRGFDLWDLTIRLHQKTVSPLIKWRLSYTVLCFNNHWRSPFRNGYEAMLETIKACVLNGDQIFTGYSVALYLRTRLMAGENLKELLDSSEDHLTLIKNGEGGLDFFQCFYQLAKALNGQTNAGGWDDESFSGNETMERLNREGNRTKLAYFHLTRCSLLYYLGKYHEALAESQTVLKYSDNILGDLGEVYNAFYASLSISACYGNFTPGEQRKYRKVLKKNLQDLKLWANGCPENYSPHYNLVRAELYAIDNKFRKALQFYETSMAEAARNGMKYVVAIANERAALLCSKTQLVKQGQCYFNDALEAYGSWGANIKCLQLENIWSGLFRIKSGKQEQSKHESNANTFGSSNNALDLASVLKASQSIASQVKYDGLLNKLLHITMENAGAEKACLLLYKGNKLCVEAVGNTGSDSIEILPSIPFDETNIVPKTIVNYCLRSEESLVEDDAFNEERLSSDPYIRENKTLSVICIPLTSQGRMIGLLYLENSLIKGAFNKNRIQLLQMLTGQIGISIENSILYENLEEKVLERTKEIKNAYSELKATQNQLIQSEKMASLGELTAGIAHEIQNPLNFVNNFSEISSELLEEMKDELIKGNSSEAIAIAEDVKQNLEKISHHGKRADGIVKGMLLHSRSSSGIKEPTDINALCDEYLRLTYHGLLSKDNSLKVKMETDFDRTFGMINVVPQDIGRVMLNLLTNAFYAVNEKMRHATAETQHAASHAASSQYAPTISVLTKKAGDKVEIHVKDNGNGIPPKVMDKIFQPFYTTKPTGVGTGLGLSLCYDIITKGHGGALKVLTKEGEFTEFIVILGFPG
jgi:histidine kinase